MATTANTMPQWRGNGGARPSAANTSLSLTSGCRRSRSTPDQHAGDRIGQIVMAARGMVDRVAARCAPCAAPGRQAGRVKRGWSSSSMRRAFSKRQQVAVEVALRPGALLELDPMLGEARARPFAGVFVADDLSSRHNGAATRRIAPPLASGSNGGRTSSSASSTQTALRPRWPIASVIESETPPDGSTKAL